MGLDVVADLAGHLLDDLVEGAEVRDVDGVLLGQHGQDVLVQVLADAHGEHLIEDLLCGVQSLEVFVVGRGTVCDGDQDLLGVLTQGGADVVNDVSESGPRRGAPASLLDGSDLLPDVVEFLTVVGDLVGADGVPDFLTDVPEELHDVEVQRDLDLGRLEGLDDVDDPFFQSYKVAGWDGVAAVHEEDEVDGVLDAAFRRGRGLELVVSCCHGNGVDLKATREFIFL